ncbi:Hypp6113 [Branchiostoma lanceolatum]|uniref:Hypp6113 protein n=1 Tax=Branchiostoma lanceolatum TaxID=7740 RepID=A0A8J9YSD6_BRALA|nr:Hypp6113 [Branchiostoma lanceolatum]
MSTVDGKCSLKSGTAASPGKTEENTRAKLRPGRQMRVWADGSKPAPVPNFNEEELDRINRLYKNFHKSWKTNVSKHNMAVVGGSIGKTWQPWTAESCRRDAEKVEGFLSTLPAGLAETTK